MFIAPIRLRNEITTSLQLSLENMDSDRPDMSPIVVTEICSVAFLAIHLDVHEKRVHDDRDACVLDAPMREKISF